MTHVDEHGNLWIIAEPAGRCELCGAVEETRPYGPGGKQICFSCGEKDPEETERQFARLFGTALCCGYGHRMSDKLRAFGWTCVTMAIVALVIVLAEYGR